MKANPLLRDKQEEQFGRYPSDFHKYTDIFFYICTHPQIPMYMAI